MPTIHMNGTVERRDDSSTDWKGRRMVRLDIRDQHGRDVHVYATADHQLGSLKVGDQVKIAGR